MLKPAKDFYKIKENTVLKLFSKAFEQNVFASWQLAKSLIGKWIQTLRGLF